MKQKSKLIEVLDEIVAADNQNDFSVVTYRTSQKIGTMLEIMSIVLQKPVATLFTTLISEKLVEVLLSDESNMELLKEYFETDHSSSGFIQLLEEQKIIQEHYDRSILDL